MSSGNAGAGGAVLAPPCEETCQSGACVFDTCLGVTSVDGPVNLTATTLSDGRACAEAPAYPVTELSSNGATLLYPVQTDCLVPGDEVLLINLQGTPAAHGNVGNWELLRVAEVADYGVTFATPKQRSYGATADADDGLGKAPTSQRVALIRVPRFGVLDVAATGAITAATWNGQLGGVVALRAGKLNLAGSIDASALGYRPGRWSEDNIVCYQSIATEAGESISGLGSASTAANVGASGGLGAANDSFNSNTPVLSTPGHALAGEPGTNGQLRTLGAAGKAYGAGDGSKLTLGSGPGGGLRCTVEDHPPRLVDIGGRGGGIVLLLADEVSVTNAGSISATPPETSRDIAFAGGYVLIRGRNLALGTARVTARGSTGHGINGPTLGFENHASPGYIVLEAADVTGSTDPKANLLAPSPAP